MMRGKIASRGRGRLELNGGRLKEDLPLWTDCSSENFSSVQSGSAQKAGEKKTCQAKHCCSLLFSAAAPTRRMRISVVDNWTRGWGE